MKKTTFFAMALAAMTMFSCSKEGVDKVIDPATPGQPVYAQFSIALPSAATTFAKAEDKDNVGTTAENEITDIAVYIIGSNRLVEAKLTATPTSGTNNFKTNILQITTGAKQVIAVVNAGTARTSAIFEKGDNLSKIEGALIANAAAAANNTNVLFSSRLTNVNVVNKKGMNGTGTTTTSETDPFQFEVTVERSVAKVIVRDGITVNANVGGAGAAYTASSAKFAINGMLTNAGLYQVGSGALTANHASSVHNWWQNGSNAISDPVQAPVALKEVAISGYGALAAPYNSAASDMTSILGDGTNGGRYTLENVVSDKGIYQNATIIYAQLQITPKAKFTTAAGIAGDDIIAGNDYYAVKHSSANEYMFFKTAKDFTDWKALPDGIAATDYVEANGTFYVGGVNYYRVNITNDNGATPALKYSLLRNKIYDVTLKEVKNFGKGTDADLVVPTDPLETQAYIEATVKVKAWTVDRQESNLE